MSAQTFPRIVLVVLAAIVFAGCSNRPKTAVVRGKVTCNGKPVPNGTVMFIPASGPAATGEIQPDGSYMLTTERSGDGAVLGAHTVTIIAMEKMIGVLPESRNPLPPPIIPLKYTSAATSDLRAEVKDEENMIDFDLDDKKSGP